MTDTTPYRPSLGAPPCICGHAAFGHFAGGKQDCSNCGCRHYTPSEKPA